VDKDAEFKAVIEANRDRIYRIACCYVRDENVRQDICQEITVHIWRSLSAFQGRSGLSTWVYRITVNTCLDNLRAAHRRSRLVQDGLPEDSEIFAVATREPGPELEDDVRHLHECIRRLPPLEKTLISLYLEDVGTREMAEILGISEGNVRVKLHRTKQRLRDLWEQRNHGS
jgi:RNA polymerase sigma factor (sigma-70 family)